MLIVCRVLCGCHSCCCPQLFLRRNLSLPLSSSLREARYLCNNATRPLSAVAHFQTQNRLYFEGLQKKLQINQPCGLVRVPLRLRYSDLFFFRSGWSLIEPLLMCVPTGGLSVCLCLWFPSHFQSSYRTFVFSCLYFMVFTLLYNMVFTLLCVT